MYSYLGLSACIWLLLNTLQSTCAFNVQFKLPSNQSDIKSQENQLIPVHFIIDQYSRCQNGNNQHHAFNLEIVLDNSAIAQFHSGPFVSTSNVHNASVDTIDSMVKFDQEKLNQLINSNPQSEVVELMFYLKANRVGYSKMKLELECVDTFSQTMVEYHASSINLLITKYKNSFWSKVFTVAVVLLVSLNTINMGCALDMDAVKSGLTRPVGPLIGLCSQYLFMPLLAYLIGLILFPEVSYLRFGLFVFGCSPGGSASNMWTVLLKGNLNLSITITMTSTFLAMFMMPLWLFTLGQYTIDRTQLKVPYGNIVGTLASMSLCLMIGLLIQRYCPKLAMTCRKILAPLSGILIGVIVVFATIVYWYLFTMMTWQVLVASTANVWFGFLIGTLFAYLCRQSREDLIAIAIETGIQNTGITFVIIRMALDSPFEDFAMTIPVAASTMSCIPLAIAYIFVKRNQKSTKYSHSDSKVKVYALDACEKQDNCDAEDAKHTINQIDYDPIKLKGNSAILSNFKTSKTG